MLEKFYDIDVTNTMPHSNQSPNKKSESKTGLLDTIRNSNLRKFSFGTLTWGTGHQMITMAQGFLLFDLTESTLWLALLGAAVGLPNFITALFGGILSDRVPRDRILMVGASVMGIPTLCIGILYASNNLLPWHILVAGMAQGLSLALDWTSRLSLLPSMVPRKILVNAISLDQSVFNLTRVIGPLAAGSLIAAVGISISYVSIALLFLISLIIYKTFVTNQVEQKEAHPPILVDLMELFDLLKKNSILGINILFTAVNAMMLGGFVFLLPAFVSEILNSDGIGLGRVLGATGAGAFIGALFVAWKGANSYVGYTLLSSNILFGISGIIFAISHNIWQGTVAAFIFGFFNAVHVSLGVAAIQINVPEHIRGRVTGAYELAWSSYPLGGLIIGAIASGVGLKIAIIIGAITVMFFTCFVFFYSPRIRNLKL